MSGKDDEAWKRERNLHVLNALRGITEPVVTERVNVQEEFGVKKGKDSKPDGIKDKDKDKGKDKEPARMKRGKVQEPSRDRSQDVIREKVQELLVEKVQNSARNRGDFADKLTDKRHAKMHDLPATKIQDTPSPLAETAPGYPVSAPQSDRISRMREPRLLSLDDLEQKRIIHPSHPHKKVIELFRDLRTNLLQISKGKNFTLVVSSAVNNGGASFVAINLAAAFAFDSSKTALLVDCNLRYPTLHHAFDMIPDLGVTDFLDDQIMDVGSIIYPTGIKRLRFIPAGKRKEATADYFTSYRMKQFMSSVRERYPDRFIFLDTPSINEFPDAGILAELADYTLIVAPHAKVTQGKVVEACARVAKDKLLGVVINN